MSRWDLSLVDQLPPYMKYYYKALLDVYVEIEEELDETGKSPLIHYVIEEVIDLLLDKLFVSVIYVSNVYIPQSMSQFSEEKTGESIFPRGKAGVQ